MERHALKVLLEYGSGYDQTIPHAELLKAATRGHEATVKMLLNAGTDQTARSNALNIAVENQYKRMHNKQYLQVGKVLVDAGVEPTPQRVARSRC
jgi:ankyrin repeat protein